MTTLEIVKIADARKRDRGWSARCPSHSDRLPSLSIREGRDGRTLLRCFAGCDLEAIVRAWGLQIGDLFSDKAPPRSVHRPPTRPTSVDVEHELNAELARILERESTEAGFPVAECARHRNRARGVVERRFSVELSREPSPWWEVEPHCVDPVWRSCVARGVRIVAIRAGLDYPALRKAIGDLPAAQDAVLREARQAQRGLAGVAA